MEFSPIFLAIAFGIFLIATLVGFFFIGQKQFDEAARQKKAEKILSEAQGEAKKLLAGVDTEVTKMREYTARVISRLESQITRLTTLLKSKENLLKKKEERNKKHKGDLEGELTTVSLLQKQAKETEQAIHRSLLQRVGIPKEKLREQVVRHNIARWEHDSLDHIHHLEEWLTENASKIAKTILGDAVYRYADISSVEFREGEIVVAHDQLKGKLIGPGGRILALIEKLFDIEIVFNDAPNTISFSCFNLVNREIAKLALERLLKASHVTEEMIPRVYEFAKKDMDRLLLKEGTEIVKKLGLGDIPVDLMKLIGRLNYRTSYGQNILRHSLEVGYFARMLASHIGADEKIAFLGGFFHDIGKAIDQEVGGSHDVLSKEILEKFGFPWEIVHAAWTHHDAIPQETVEAILVKAGDALSAGRPGARSISFEQYLEKIRDLEETAMSFEGVKKSYAISAGREVRALVDPEIVNDGKTIELAKAIAGKIEEKGGYPGRIKVTTIRLTKASGVAKQKSPARK